MELTTLQAALKDARFGFGFDFNGARWFFVIRATETHAGCPRVDVFEDGEAVGAGYLPGPTNHPQEDGPMFDGSHSTPIGGCSLCAPRTGDDDEGEAEAAEETLMEQWGTLVHYHWNLVAKGYRASTGPEAPRR